MQCRRRTISSLFLSLKRKSSTVAPLILRPYQELCLDSCTDALASGSTRIGVSLPTGAGKTTVFISLLSRIPVPATNEAATKSLIIVNSVELARQSADHVARMFPHWVVEIEQGAKHQATGTADVTIATYQTLNNEQRLMKFDSKLLKAIIIDEAHHAAAPSYRRLLSRFDPDIKHPDGLVVDKPPHKIPIIGFSATFSRHDGLALGSVFERIVYHRDFLDMIKEQWLCDVRFTSVRAKIDLDKVTINSRTGDFNATSLAQVVNSESINNLVVRSWIDRASNRKSTLVFCVNIAHVKALTQAFRDHGIDARYIFAATPNAERKELVNSFKNGEFPVLINCAILTEGADIPNIDCVVLARPTRSRNLFAQMIGRGMRLSPNTGKTDCRIIDFVDSHTRVGGVISVPTLFGLDPSEIDIDDETPESLTKRMAQMEASVAAQTGPAPTSVGSVPNPSSITYTDHDDPFSLVEEDGPTSPHISASSFCWVNCSDGIYVLELHGKGFIRIEPYEVDVDVGVTLYRARYTAANTHFETRKFSPFLQSRLIMSSLPLSEAIRACDTFVMQNVFRNSSTFMLLRSSPWRRASASDAQRRLILQRRRADPEFGMSYELPHMNKGQAATIITRLRHGSAILLVQ
ncbi:P-loop containing nucleoside triphosphate hydrolase protein [Flammula alnicola]|nr:P-loop containing nucleoside triphosphate hydrolase protein [Flammula alnicola]